MTTLSAPQASKTQLAYDWLRERITTGEFNPGHRLVLGKIATELGCSTVPVREAIRMLEAEGAVTFTHNVGAQVAIPDRTIYRDTMQTLSVVEAFATAQSAPQLTASDLAEARAINDQMRVLANASALDPTEFTRLNRNFHEVLFQHCNNNHIADLVQRGWHRLETMRESSFGFVPERTRESVTEHDELLKLIETGAPAADIEASARAHRLNTMDAVLTRTQPHHD